MSCGKCIDRLLVSESVALYRNDPGMQRRMIIKTSLSLKVTNRSLVVSGEDRGIEVDRRMPQLLRDQRFERSLAGLLH